MVMSLQWQEAWWMVQQHPLFGVLLTIFAYQCGVWINQYLKQTAFAHPLLIGLVLMLFIIELIHYDLADYQKSTEMMNALLGPIVVALAVPLYLNLKYILRMKWMIVTAIGFGAVMATLSVLLTATLLEVEQEIILSLSPKSATTAIAVIVSEKISGLVAITAVCVVLTGVFAAMTGPWIFRLLNIDDERIEGVALGVVGHAIGTAKAFEKSELCGAFATLAMILTGLLIAILVPFWVVPYVIPWLLSM